VRLAIGTLPVATPRSSVIWENVLAEGAGNRRMMVARRKPAVHSVNDAFIIQALRPDDGIEGSPLNV
jgi:hypothetical protein